MSDLVADRCGRAQRPRRVVALIENRSSGYREIISDLHQHTGTADVSASPAAPARASRRWSIRSQRPTASRDRPSASSPSTHPRRSPAARCSATGSGWPRTRRHGRVLPVDVARGSLGGLSTATTDAVTALDAFGKDRSSSRRSAQGKTRSTSSAPPIPSPCSSAGQRRRRADAQGRHPRNR